MALIEAIRSRLFARGDPVDESFPWRLDLDRREIIHHHYDVTEGQANTIADIMAPMIGGGYSAREIERTVGNAVALDDALVRRIIQTEVLSITLLQQLVNYHAQPGGISDRAFLWIGPEDGHAICRDVAETTHDRGGVPVQELHSLLRQRAAESDDGTPERMDHWIPHEQCKYTIVEHFES